MEGRSSFPFPRVVFIDLASLHALMTLSLDLFIFLPESEELLDMERPSMCGTKPLHTDTQVQ